MNGKSNLLNQVHSQLKNLRHIKEFSALLLAAHSLAVSGTTRATAHLIAVKATSIAGSDITFSLAGQLLKQAGLAKVIIHGKAHFVLDQQHMADLIQQTDAQAEKLFREVNGNLETFSWMSDRLKNLEMRYQDIQELDRKGRALYTLVIQNQKLASRVNELERQNAGLQTAASRARDLAKENERLAQLIEALPSLEQRKLLLETRLMQYQDSEKRLVAEETRLAALLQAFQNRSERIELISLQRSIKTAQIELKDLQLQLDEKRSLRDRLFPSRDSKGGQA